MKKANPFDTEALKHLETLQSALLGICYYSEDLIHDMLDENPAIVNDLGFPSSWALARTLKSMLNDAATIMNTLDEMYEGKAILAMLAKAKPEGPRPR
jgi:hypothetical protein